MSDQFAQRNIARTPTLIGAGALTQEQRRYIVGLHSSRTQAAKILGVSQVTFEELARVGGNLRAVTLERARARIAELQGR